MKEINFEYKFKIKAKSNNLFNKMVIFTLNCATIMNLNSCNYLDVKLKINYFKDLINCDKSEILCF